MCTLLYVNWYKANRASTSTNQKYIHIHVRLSKSKQKVKYYNVVVVSQMWLITRKIDIRILKKVTCIVNYNIFIDSTNAKDYINISKRRIRVRVNAKLRNSLSAHRANSKHWFVNTYSIYRVFIQRACSICENSKSHANSLILLLLLLYLPLLFVMSYCKYRDDYTYIVYDEMYIAWVRARVNNTLYNKRTEITRIRCNLISENNCEKIRTN